MKYTLHLTRKGKEDLLNLEKIVQKRVVKKLRYFMSRGDPLHYAKKLKDNRLGTYRFRIGDYRIIFDIDKDGKLIILIILRIKHRKEAYL